MNCICKKASYIFVFVLFSPQVFNHRHFKDAYRVTSFITVRVCSSSLGTSSAEVARLQRLQNRAT